MGKKAEEILQISIDHAVSSAFFEVEELKEEIQQWFDNMPENLQGGTKGQKLEEAIDQLEANAAPDVPEHIKADTIESHKATLSRMSRKRRLENCCTRLRAAIDHARNEATALEELPYDSEGVLEEGCTSSTAPLAEEDRDALVLELQSFADDAENAVDEWDNVEFPGTHK